MHWTPISNPPEPYAPIEPFFDPPYGIHSQVPSHTSSGSWGDTSTDGDYLISDSVDAGDHLGLRQCSVSPNIETKNDVHRKRHDAAIKDPSLYSSSYISNRSTNTWVPNDEYLKPSSTSPPLVSPHSGISPDFQPYGTRSTRSPGQTSLVNRPAGRVVPDEIYVQRTNCQRPVRHLSHSPLSRTVSRDDQPTSVSPTRSDGSLSQKAATPPANVSRKKPRGKAHNAIERRYRIRLNEKIAELRDSIPSLRINPGSPSDGNPKDDLSGSTHKVNKANVLEKATEYIKSLEMCNRRLQAELNRVVTLSRNNNPSIHMQSLPNAYAGIENGYEMGQQPTTQTNHVPEMFAYTNRAS